MCEEPYTHSNRFYRTEKIDEGKRLDTILGSIWKDLSRTYAKKLILDGQVLINNSVQKEPRRVVQEGQEISITLPPPRPTKLIPENIPLDIIYEDSHIMVVNKPAGLVVHPGAGNPNKTLVNALLYYCKDNLSGISGEQRPGIVHRLDKDTSGLLVVAKSNEAHLALAEQFSDRTLSRTYLAITHSLITPLKGSIKEKISRSQHNRQKMAVFKNHGKVSITHYHVQKQFLKSRLSLVKCKLETGRTHQIRVHMSYKGWPIVGDKLYGQSRPKKSTDTILKSINWPDSRQALHAYKLTLNHPISQEKMNFKAPIPNDMSLLLKHIETFEKES